MNLCVEQAKLQAADTIMGEVQQLKMHEEIFHRDIFYTSNILF